MAGAANATEAMAARAAVERPRVRRDVVCVLTRFSVAASIRRS
jgi:hypothetical protein